MPLESLRESIHTLAELTHRSRELRRRDDVPVGAVEQLERMVDETIDNMKTLVDMLLRAHRTGKLDEIIRNDRDEDGHDGSEPVAD